MKAGRKEIIKFVIIRTAGNFLVLFSLFGAVMTFGPAIYHEALFRYNLARNISFEVAQKQEEETHENKEQESIPNQGQTFFGQITGGNRTELIEPVSVQFGLVIPKINANVAVFPNIDPGRPEVYLDVLTEGVAHALGTVFPGVEGNIYLFAHSTDSFWNVGRYNAVFYLLKELENGDEINVFFQGVRHIYRVVNKVVVDPSEVGYLTLPTIKEQLTLQTCWPPGTTFKRMIVIAKPEREFSIRDGGSMY